MKRYLMVLAMVCALVLAVGTGSAFAGDLLPIPIQSGSQDQDVSNHTGQENEAVAISPTLLSGNNLALINLGDQTATAGTEQNQGNVNATDQTAVQAAEQQPSASKQDGYGRNGTDSSSGTSQRPDQDQDVVNGTNQENEAFALSPTIASGNNLALINGGDQTATAGTEQNQGNVNATDQTAVQAAEQVPHQSQGRASQSGSQDQNVSNRTHQENKAFALSPTILSGNNLALINGGDQNATAGTEQNQGKLNWTKQTAVQVADQDQHAGSSPSHDKSKNDCRCKNDKWQPSGPTHESKGTSECRPKEQHSSGPSQRLEQDQNVSNRTHQENKAFALSPTILSGNNLALINGGDQNATAGTEQNQGNFNWTKQTAVQVADQDQHAGSSPSHDKSKNDCRCKNDKWQPSGPTHESKGTSECRPKEQHSSGPSQRLEQDQNVSNRTHQENKAFALSPTILSGNNLALINGGDQNATAGTEQNQGNFNWTKQTAVQVADQDQHAGSSPSHDKSKNDCRCKNDKWQPSGPTHESKGTSECRPKEQHSSGPSQRLEQDQNVSNRTHQENKAFALSPTILSGNNLALINGGDQNATAGTEQNQGNFNWTSQKAFQGAFQDQHGLLRR